MRRRHRPIISHGREKKKRKWGVRDSIPSEAKSIYILYLHAATYHTYVLIEANACHMIIDSNYRLAA
jgi:hypothetical protein